MGHDEDLPVVKFENFANKVQEADSLVSYIIDIAKKNGADQVEASINLDCGFVVSILNRNLEKIEFHNAQSLNLTVYFGKQKADVVINDFHESAVKEATNRVCDMAKELDQDMCVGLADRELMFTGDILDLALYKPKFLTISEVSAKILLCEGIALDYDKYIKRSEGASGSEILQYSLYANSYGFKKGIHSSSYGFSCGVIGEEHGKMQRDSFYTVAHDYHDLLAVEKVGEQAAAKTCKRKNAKKIKTRQASVLFLPEEARRLLSSFLAAISGGNIYRRSSFLVNHINKQVFPNFIDIYEDPFLQKGWGSRFFDAEGVGTKKKTFIESGILSSYILNSYTARKLGLQTTGNAGGVHNLHISSKITHSYEDLVRLMHSGLIVVETLGHGANIVTGDYSQGVFGFWVENGEIQHAVEEVTVAGNLQDMFYNLQAIGNDYDNRNNIITGSLLFSALTIAGI